MPTDPPRLYSDLAHLWPHLSPPGHYEEEARLLGELIDAALGEPPAGQRWSLLELGAGAGHTLVHLKGRYDCTASDLSPQMIAHGRELNPEVPAVVGDMRTMRLGKRFDIVLLCDAIDYMLSEDDAAAALTTAREHLRPGGVVLFAPTYTAETFVDGEVASDDTLWSGQDARGAQARAGVTYFSFVHDPDPADTRIEMILVYLLRDARTRQVEVVEDRHVCGLFPIARWCDLAGRAGLVAEALAEPGGGDGPSAWSVLFRAGHRVP